MRFVCPYCGEAEDLYEDNTEIIRFGPITFDDDGKVTDESYESYESMADTVEFDTYHCGACGKDFDQPEAFEEGEEHED